MQRQCLRIPIRAGELEKVSAWIRRLSDRSAEVAAAVTSEGIVSECVLLDLSGSSPALLLYTASPDLARAAAGFQSSTHAVDVEFRALLQSSLDLASATAVEVLFGWP